MGEGGFVSHGDHALWAMGVLFMMAGCGGHTTSGVTCGPGTVLAGEVCLPAPSGNDGSAGVNPDGMAQEAGPDGMTPEAGPDATVPDGGALPDGAVSDAPASLLDAGEDVTDGSTGSTADSAGDVAAQAQPDSASQGEAGPYTIGPAPNCAGATDVTSATLVPIEGGLSEVRIDPCHLHVYATNSMGNRVEDFSVVAGALEAPIPVGSDPHGLDITPDGARLYVANTGGTNVSAVDLATRREIEKIEFTSNFSGDTPLSIAIAKNGKAFFSTTFSGSGFGGRMMTFDLASEVVTQAPGFYSNGTTTEATMLTSSADHSTIGVVAGDISSAPVFVYTTATGNFSPEHDLNGFVSEVAVSPDGSLLLVDGSYVLDDKLNLLGTIPGAATAWATFGASSAIAYRSATDHVDVLDTATFLVSGSIPVTADTMTGVGFGSTVGNLAASSDGRFLAIVTDNGLTMVPVP
jgi:YVTN family beta-propeller protein